MTIGKELSHIENAKLEDVKNFFFKHYRPVNAILVVAGNVTVENVRELAEKWFGGIPAGEKYQRNLPQEAPQREGRKLEVHADVPLDALYKCWHIYPRLDKRYYVADLLTDILSGGGSSRLYQTLVKEKKLFSNVDCSHHGTADAGVIIFEGKLVKGITMDEAENALNEILEQLKREAVTENELQKVKNKTESMIAFEDMSVMSRANSLAYYELLGDASWINNELEKYNAVTSKEMQEESRHIFDEKNSNTLYYYAN